MSEFPEGKGKKVVVTGGAGGLGVHISERLRQGGHRVRVVDVPSPANRKTAERWGASIQTVWGDVTDPIGMKEALREADDLIHLAAIVPPRSETAPEASRKVNIEGTRNVLDAAKAESDRAGRPARVHFTSSVTVYGVVDPGEAPLKSDRPLNPSDHYTEAKVKGEEAVKSSGLPWTVFRLSAIMHLKIRKGDFGAMRMIAPDNKIEFGHVLDVADALANSIETRESVGKTFNIAGGEKCRMLYRDAIKGMFGMFGFPDPDWRKFETKPYYLHWYDTEEAQRILNFQSRDYGDYLRDFARANPATMLGVRLGAPFMRLFGIRI